MPTTTGKATDLITFSRGTLATVTDSDGKVKWAPHNLFWNSEQFDAAYWTKTASTVAANAVAAPNGTMTADKLAENNTNDAHKVDRQSVIDDSAPVSTLGVFAKAAERQYVNLTMEWGANYVAATFDLSGGTVTSTRAGGTGAQQAAAITAVGNGWYLCTLTGTIGTGGADANTIAVSNVAVPTGAQPSYTGTTGSGIYIWGAHLYRSDLGGMQANPSVYPMYNPSTPKNLLGYSEDFSNAAWDKTTFAATVAANDAAAPNGSMTADKITANATSNRHIAFQATSINPSSPATFTTSVYAKAGGANYAILGIVDNSDAAAWAGSIIDLSTGTVTNTYNGAKASAITAHTPVSLGSGWYRIGITATLSADASNISVRVGPFNAASASPGAGGYFDVTWTALGTESIYLWGAQLSDSASLDPYVPSFGAAPSAAAYHGPRLDYRDGSALGLLVEEARTNVAVWTNRLIVSHSITITGLSGTFTNGETITATGGGSGVYLLSGSSSSVVLLTAGSGTFSGTLTGGSSGATATVNVATSVWAPTNVTTAQTQTGPDGTANSATLLTATAGNATVLQAITLASSARFQSAYVKRVTGTGTIEMTMDNGSTWTAVTVTSSWTRVSIPSATITNPTVGFRIVTSGDEIAVFGVQNETGAFATSVIPTAAATVTRNADWASVGVSQFPYSATEGTWVANFQTLYSGTTSATGLLLTLDADLNKRILYSITGTDTMSSKDASTIITATGDITGSPSKSASAYDASGRYVVSNGGTVASGAITAGYSSGSVMYISNGGSPVNLWLRQITYLPRKLSNAELQSRTA